MRKLFWWSIGLIVFSGCDQSDAEDPFSKRNYLGVVKLDSTLLLATEVRAHLDVPWEITYGPDGWIWFTEQKGMVNRLNPATGKTRVLLFIKDVLYKKSLGLTSMALHPDFSSHPHIFLHYTFADGEYIKSRIVRYTYANDKLIDPFIILDSIPGKTYHNGSRMLVTSDEKLYFAMGDAGDNRLAQNVNHLNGKILRLNTDGSIPSDNPIPNNPVWSWGHRNPQGLVFADDILYSSEHGVNNDDEINIIRMGNNYGWPDVEGYIDLPAEQLYSKDSVITEPIHTWSPTIAPAGLDYYNHNGIPEWKNSLLLASLKGRSLRVLNLSGKGKEVDNEHIFFQKRFGRIRDVCIGADGSVYLSTSNLDWHPKLQPWMYDSLPAGGDRIIRLQPIEQNLMNGLNNLKLIREDSVPLKMDMEVWDFKATDEGMSAGQALYMENCVSCHLSEGQGVEGLIPPLRNTNWVTGDKSRLIRTLLLGLSEPIDVNGIIYEQEMPSFSYLSDQQLADILTYVRNGFGNDASAVIPGEVLVEREVLE